MIEQTAEEVEKDVELAGKDLPNLMKNLTVIKKIILELLYIWLIVEHFHSDTQEQIDGSTT